MIITDLTTAPKYSIIYADPPWKYRESWGNGAAKHSYSDMTVEEIKAIPVRSIAAEKSHLYLWVTNSFIKEGLDVMQAWGFEYKTLITWVKQYKNGMPEMGMGYYFRGCTEHMLFGVRGKMKCQNKVTKNLFFAENPKRHSQKPSITRDIIVTASGDLPRIELFARQTADGWDSWGNEMEGSA